MQAENGHLFRVSRASRSCCKQSNSATARWVQDVESTFNLSRLVLELRTCPVSAFARQVKERPRSLVDGGALFRLRRLQPLHSMLPFFSPPRTALGQVDQHQVLPKPNPHTCRQQRHQKL